MIKILLVDDQKTVRESLRSWLEPIEDFEIVGTASDGHSAIEQVEILKPDIVLIDMEMPVLDGVETTAIICQKFIGVKVIILSMHDDNEYVARSLQAGATGYLLKNTPKEELIEAITFVNRGYSQLAPGLVNKVVASMPTAQPIEVQENKANDLEYARVTNIDEIYINNQRSPLPTKPRDKKFYLKIWLLGNLFIWLASFAYLQFRPPSYTSKWTLALPSSNSSTSIELPGVGQASSQSESPYNSDFADPRENYKYLAGTEEVLDKAAQSIGMPLTEFGNPKVEIPGNTTLIEFQINGEEPELAQIKAIAIQNALQQSLQRLRNDESSNNSQQLENTLQATREKLKQARQKLAQFKISSGLSSTEQNSNLTYNIEGLRKQRAEIIAQKQKISSRFNELRSSLGLSAQEAADALILQSDPQFKEYLSNYGEVSRELVNLKAEFSDAHPAVVAKQAQQNDTQAEFNRRAESLLGRPFDFDSLKALNINSNDYSQSQRASLFQELISLQAEQEGLGDQGQSLKEQIAELEVKQANMSQSGSELEKLQREVQLAEAVFLFHCYPIGSE